MTVMDLAHLELKILEVVAPLDEADHDEIAYLTGLSPRTTSALCDNLCRRGHLANRHPDRPIVHITNPGREHLIAHRHELHANAST